MITIVLFFSRIRRKFRISRRAERVNYRPLKHPMDGRVEGSRVTRLRVANSYARNRKLARVCVQQMRRPREPRSEIFRALSLSPPPPTREGGKRKAAIVPGIRWNEESKIEQQDGLFSIFFFCRYSLSLFFFRLPFQRLSSSSSGKNWHFFFMVLVREDLFPSDTNITCLVRPWLFVRNRWSGSRSRGE